MKLEQPIDTTEPAPHFQLWPQRRAGSGAFSWSELLAILAFLAVVAAVLLPGFASARRRDRPAKLLHAAANGDLVTVKSLVEQGVPVNCTPGILPGWTPLHAAVFYCRTNVVSYLVEKGADVNARDMNGQTPLMCLVAIQGDKGVAIARILVEHGAKLDVADRGGGTVLMYVRGLTNRPKLRELLEAAQMQWTNSVRP